MYSGGLISGGEPTLLTALIAGAVSMAGMANAGRNDDTLGGLLGALSMGAGPIMQGASSMGQASNLAIPAAQVMGKEVPNLAKGGLSFGMDPLANVAKDTATLGSSVASSTVPGLTSATMIPPTPSFSPTALTGSSGNILPPTSSATPAPVTPTTTQPVLSPTASKQSWIDRILNGKNNPEGMAQAIAAGGDDPTAKMLLGLEYMKRQQASQGLRQSLLTGGVKGVASGIGKALEDKPYTPDYRMSTIRQNRENRGSRTARDIIEQARNRRKLRGLR